MPDRFVIGSPAPRERPGRPASVNAEPPGRTRQGTLNRRRFLASALLAIGAVGLAGCTLAVPTPPPATPTAAPAQTPSDLAIGTVLSLSGRYSREGALLRAGYEAWAEAVGQAGGIKVGSGRRAVRLVYADDESEPLNAGRQAERLASSERSRLWLGPFTSAITTAVAIVADRVGAVVVAPDASAGGLYRRGLKGIVSILAPDDRLLHGLADLAATSQPRAQPVGILIADEPSNAAAAAGFRERASALDLGPVRLELTALGSQDVSAPLERIAEDAPRCVIVATEAGQTARFTPTIRELVPFTTMRVLMPLPEPSNRSGHRDVIYDGVMTVETWWPSIAASGPVLGSARDFVERFRRLHGYEPDSRSAAAAAAGLVLQLAIEQSGSVEPAAVRDTFSTLDVTTFWGRLAWDTAGRNRVAVAPVLQQQGDALVAVYPRELAGGRHRYPLAGWPRG
jgi:branched-chain amino acid transport system substrate-binding protein